ncbi:MAG: hypothetical protein SGILL_010739 [Bacillariaceae sp.]
MSAGYPDSQQAFTPMAKRLASSSECLVGITCPPGYDDALDVTAYPKEGFTFEDWIPTLREAVKALRKYSQKSVEQTTLTGIFHDWGVVMGCMYANQVVEEKDLKLDRIVIYDVLLPPHRKCKDWDRTKKYENKSLWNYCCFMIYQLFLAGAFLCNRYLPKYLTLVYYMVGSAFMQLLGTFPVSQSDTEYIEASLNVREMSTLHRIWYMSYPYFQFWKHVFTGNMRDLYRQLSLPQDLVETPVLYLYGASKRYDLGDANAVELLKQQEQTEGRHSRVLEVKNAGHWLYYQQPDICFNAMQKFFQATIGASKTK